MTKWRTKWGHTGEKLKGQRHSHVIESDVAVITAVNTAALKYCGILKSPK